MSKRNYQNHDAAPLSLYNQSTTAPPYISNHKNGAEKKPGKQRSDVDLCYEQHIVMIVTTLRRLRRHLFTYLSLKFFSSRFYAFRRAPFSLSGFYGI